MISQSQIIDATLEIGLDRFTMVSVANRLGVTTPALYSYVSSRDEVVGLVIARMLERVNATVDTAGDWRTFLTAYARTMHDGLRRSQWAIFGPLGESSAAAEFVERGLGVLMNAGFEPSDSAEALWLVFRVVMTAGSPEASSLAVQRGLAPQLVDPPSEFPNLRSAAGAMDSDAVNDTFERDLEVVLDGLAARLQRRLDRVARP